VKLQLPVSFSLRNWSEVEISGNRDGEELQVSVFLSESTLLLGCLSLTRSLLLCGNGKVSLLVFRRVGSRGGLRPFFSTVFFEDFLSNFSSKRTMRKSVERTSCGLLAGPCFSLEGLGGNLLFLSLIFFFC